MAAPTTKSRSGDTPARTWRELRHEWLFGREEEVTDLADDLDLAEHVKQGLPAKCLLVPVRVFDFRPSEVGRWIDDPFFSSHSSSTPIDRPSGTEYKKQFVQWLETLDETDEGSEIIPPEASDELASVLRVLAKTLETFGEAEKAKRWLDKPNQLLREKKPADLLDTEAGRQAVEKVLIRIGHGVFS